MLLKLFFRWLFSCDFGTWCNFPTVPNIRGLHTNLLAAVLKAITTDQIVRRRPRDPPHHPPRTSLYSSCLLLENLREKLMEEEGQQNPSRSPGRPGPMTDQRSDRYPQFLASFRSHGARGRERGGRQRGRGGTRTDRRKVFTEGEVLDGRELGEGGGSCRDEDRKSETLQFFSSPKKRPSQWLRPSFLQ